MGGGGGWWLRRQRSMKTNERHSASVRKRAVDQKHLLPSPAIPLQPNLCQDPTHSCSPPHLLFLPPPPLLSCPFFTYLPSPLLLLTPSLVRLLIRAGGTIVPLLPLFGNPGLKQTLFTQAVAQPGPSPSLQPGQVWLSLFSKCYNKPLSQPLRLIHSASISFPSTSSPVFLLQS